MSTTEPADDIVAAGSPAWRVHRLHPDAVALCFILPSMKVTGHMSRGEARPRAEKAGGQKNCCVVDDQVVVFGMAADSEAIGARILTAKKCSPVTDRMDLAEAPLASVLRNDVRPPDWVTSSRI